MIMSSCKQVKITVEGDEYVCGTLHVKSSPSNQEQWNKDDLDLPQARTPGEKIILLLHGLNTDRNTIFYPILSESLTHSNFRFDFRGSGKSSGEPAPFKNYNQRELKDVTSVAKAFGNKGYEIYGIIGHSKGGTLVAQILGLYPHFCTFAINISGRLNVYEGMSKRFSDKLNDLEQEGSFIFEVKVGNKLRTNIITKQDIEAFKCCDQDISKLLNHHSCASLLTIHGGLDNIVAFDEQLNILNCIKNHKLYIIKECGHFFVENYKGVIDAILECVAYHDQIHDKK